MSGSVFHGNRIFICRGRPLGRGSALWGAGLRGWAEVGRQQHDATRLCEPYQRGHLRRLWRGSPGCPVADSRTTNVAGGGDLSPTNTGLLQSINCVGFAHGYGL